MKYGKFPPKPADIMEYVEIRRQQFRDEKEAIERERPDYEGAAKSRQQYFQSEEYKQFLERMKAKGL